MSDQTFSKSCESPAAAEAEREGLKALAAGFGVHHNLRIPAIHPSSDSGTEIVMDKCVISRPTQSYWKKLGTELASLHKNVISPHEGQFGLGFDNYCGAGLQPNAWSDNWGEFFLKHRLMAQAERIEDETKRAAWIARFEQVGPVIVEFLNWHKPVASLVHGDLWSGNALCGEGGEPWLIDPAHYYGDREVDIAMTKFFGGFSPVFYEAYEAEFEIPGSDREKDMRVEIYNLWHCLNHYNMFGEGYSLQAEGIWMTIAAMFQ